MAEAMQGQESALGLHLGASAISQPASRRRGCADRSLVASAAHRGDCAHGWDVFLRCFGCARGLA